MTRIRLQYFLLFLTGIMFSLNGCMKEDYSDCGLYLQFKFTNHNGGGNDMFREFNSVDVFVFKAGGAFVGQWKHDPSTGNELHLKLEKGVYTIVAWGNLSEDFSYSSLQPGVTTLEEAILSIRRDAENNVTAQPRSLYHAMAADLNIKEIGLQYTALDFYHSVNHIEVNIEGLPIPSVPITGRSTAAPGTRFSVQIAGNNGDYKFDHTRWEQAPTLTYIPHYSQSYKRLTSSFSLMRLSKDDNTRIILLHTEADGSQRELYNESLIKLLTSNPELDLDINSEYQINLTFDYTYTLIGVTVNEWNVVDADDGQGGVIG